MYILYRSMPEAYHNGKSGYIMTRRWKQLAMSESESALIEYRESFRMKTGEPAENFKIEKQPERSTT